MSALNEVVVRYTPRGAAMAAFLMRDPELVLSGPAGTGKSRSILEKVHLALLKYPGARALMVRKTRRSLTESGMVTYERKVLHDLDGVRWRSTNQQYQYPNGSLLAVAGLDKPGKVMSSEWDIIYVQEATEVGEPEWEACTTRLRNGKMSYQQLIADCNPDAPTHWLRLRMDAGKTKELVSRHEDNPVLFTEGGQETAEGTRYLAVLDALSGVRYQRLRKGQWAAAEGTVYEEVWDRGIHVIDRRPIPLDWPRYLAVDFGYTNPFTCGWYAVDPDGRCYLYREIYMTGRTVEDHAATIMRVSGWDTLRPNMDPLPQAIITDHDAEGRATLEQHLVIGGRMLATMPADKAVSEGIQAMRERLRVAGDGKPRFLFLRDSLVERDQSLVDRKLPTCLTEEFDSYVWARTAAGQAKEQPEKLHDHGMDQARYLAMYLRDYSTEVTYGPNIW